MSWRGRIGFVIVVVILISLVVGVAYLAFFDVPAPSAKVEKVLPDDRFPK